jgi:hypothetical protein
MIDVTYSYEDNGLEDRLRGFGRDAPKILDKVLRRTGSAYRKHMRRNYLRGQMLGRRSGDTYKSIKVRKVRGKHAYRVTPGPLAMVYESDKPIIIRPKDAPVLRWINSHGEWRSAREVRLRPRPFVTASYESFDWSKELREASNKVLQRELARRFGNA